jgi:putative ATPase
VPLAIRNAPTPLMSELGYGREYVYAPDTEDGMAGLECLPESVRGQRFYEPGELGFEADLKRRRERLDALRRRLRDRAGPRCG